MERYPGVKVVATPRGKELLVDLLLIDGDRVITVNDKETISLGDRTMEFIHAPWVHWPETMLTYLREEKILFSCDLFGSHLATSDLYADDEGQVYEAAKRYYAEIMMPFHTNIQRHLERIKGYAIDIVGPSHGPLYARPEFILTAYRSWVFDPPRNIVVLPYVSMHGTTRRMVDYLVGALVGRGGTVKQFDLTSVDSGRLAVALVDAATLVVASPQVLAGLHPAAAYAAFFTNMVRPKLRFVSLIGSYGWGGKMDEQLKGMLSSLKAEQLEPVVRKGFPRETDFRALDKLAEVIAQKHRDNGFT